MVIFQLLVLFQVCQCLTLCKPENVAGRSTSRLLLVWALRVKARDLQASCVLLFGFLFRTGNPQEDESGRCSIDQTVCLAASFMELRVNGVLRLQKKNKRKVRPALLGRNSWMPFRNSPCCHGAPEPKAGLWHCDFLMAKQPCPALALGGK